MYFVINVLKGDEQHYHKIGNLELALVSTDQKLRHYFQGHSIIVRTNYPIKQILKKPDLAWRMVTWDMKLSEYDIEVTPRTRIKSQVLTDFVVELSNPILEENVSRWTLHVDGSSNLKGSRVGIILEGIGDFILEYSLGFYF